MLSSFTPIFLRRVDAYQEILRQNKRDRGPWEIEKELLIWGGSEHNHLESVWKYEDIKKRIKVSGLKDNELVPAIGNLEFKKLAISELRENIRFTDSGIMMGEVLHSIKNPLVYCSYWISLRSLQLLLPALTITAFLALINQVLELVKK